MDLATVIRKSMRAFACGVFGLVPLLGIVPGVCALRLWFEVRRDLKGHWNPAAAYLDWGVRLSVFGLALDFLLAMLGVAKLEDFI